jgi:hypothetical protein
MRARHLDDGLLVPGVGDIVGDGLDPALGLPGQLLEAVGAWRANTLMTSTF